MKCIFCEQEIKDDAKFCTKCGKQIPRCPTCGRVITKKARFCIKDGTPLPEEILALVPDGKMEKKEVDDLSSTVGCRPPVPTVENAQPSGPAQTPRTTSNASTQSSAPNGATTQSAARTVTASSAPPKKKKSCLPVVLIVLLIMMLLGGGLLIVGGVIVGLLGFNVKNMADVFETVEQYEEEYYVEEEEYDDSNSYGEVEEEIEEDESESTQEPEQQTDTSVQMPTGLAYVIENCDKTYLTATDLQGFDAETCRIARNAIYAKHGRKFTDPALQQYFSQFAWYTPTIEPDAFTESMLNAYEIANRDLIVAYETEHGYR